MNVQLKSIKHFPSMSDETEAFNAAIWMNGKKVGTVSNQGCGGPNDWHFTDKGLEMELKKHIDQMPPESVTFCGETHEIKMDMDQFFTNLLADYLKAKETARIEKWAQKEKSRLIAAGCAQAIQIENGLDILIVGVMPNKTNEEAFAACIAKRKWTNAKFKQI
jgi:hypothetical protein